jgi:hypothetical protein
LQPRSKREGATAGDKPLYNDPHRQSRLPTIFPFRFFAEQGGLIAYGPDPVVYYRRAAGYIARILQGAKPSEMPMFTLRPSI